MIQFYVDAFFVVSGSGSSRNSASGGDFLNRLPLSLDIDGANPILLSIVCTSLSGTSNVTSSMNWREIY